MFMEADFNDKLENQRLSKVSGSFALEQNLY